MSTAGEKISVPPRLAKKFSVDKRYDVPCLDIRRTNRQGLTGWRAVNLIEQEAPHA
ncbi:hypothetical protein [Massilia sp. TWR1-2-2]|uniref:hypothetical protein n=1 Tax=Massilia sp. TWR1-2-2 TaxID=2804584 RepID=UPI003CED5E4B